MNILIKIWNQNSIVKWLLYFLSVYVLFIIKDAFAIVIWFLFCLVLYYLIFPQKTFKAGSFYEKKL